MIRGSMIWGVIQGRYVVNGAFPTVVCSGLHVVENFWAVKEISAGLPKRINLDGWLPRT